MPSFFSWGIILETLFCSALRLSVEAMRALRDMGAHETWLKLYQEVFADEALDLGAKEALLAIPADSLDRRRRARVRENVREMRALRKAAARAIGTPSLVAALAGAATAGLDAAAIVRRAWENRVLELLAAADEPETWAAIWALRASIFSSTSCMMEL